ncbi:hypothetical protein [Mesorhizobium sp. Mes31]|uniref:hypothetical protein n=1 Tax=Mesorhizobium sp. Mes31 TaxID=2926017 RepID=UPI0021184169|nr:hypothetical protein [Mesorhizobium sp. Mes31]
MVDLATIDWKEPEEAKQERQRRLEAILSGRHPETGNLLERDDLPSFKRTAESMAAEHGFARIEQIPDLLEAMAVEFQRDRPLVPWEAIQLARDFDLPLPAWLMQYLFAVSDRLVGIADNPGKRKKGFRQVEAAGEALGFGGAGRAFDIRKNAAFDEEICGRVQRYVDAGDKESNAWKYVAADLKSEGRKPNSASTVAASWRAVNPDRSDS